MIDAETDAFWAKRNEPVLVSLGCLEWLLTGFKQSGGSSYAIRDMATLNEAERVITAAGGIS